MKNIIVIKTDGGNEIGLGHVYRSINLAKQLKNNNYKIIFLTKSSILRKIIPLTFPIKKINENVKTLEKILDEIKPKIIILDKLYENSNELKILNNKSQVLAIDYIGKNKFYLKNGINILYQKSGIRGKNSVSGFAFAILSNSIKIKKAIKISKQVKKILVIQGGSDTPCNTPLIIDSLNSLQEKMKVDVIVGASFECWKKLDKSIKNSNHQIKLFHNIRNIGEIMEKNDMAITGGGMTSLELCHLGIPSIIICGAPFEEETASLLEKNGFGMNLGYMKKLSKEKIAVSVKELMMDFKLRKGMNKIGQKLVDGDGSKRVANEISRRIK
jgi:UDP-2,4-diacetamido-2,4,6-trideoxy-beta-L-altropyranose hydrolase